MPCSPRWSALTLVTTETSLRVSPMPLSRMPPRAVSVTASCDARRARAPGRRRSGRSSRPPRPARRRCRCRRCWTSRRACPACGRCGRSSATGRGLAVGAGDRDDRDPRGDRVRRGRRPGRRRPAAAASARPPPRRRPPAAASSTSATARPISWRALAVPPRVGHDEPVRVAGRPDPDGEPASSRTRARPRAPAGPPPARRTAGRKPVSGSPGRASRSPIRRANRAAVSVGAAARPLMSRVSLTAARGK